VIYSGQAFAALGCTSMVAAALTDLGPGASSAT
jgi:hypothetical protein